MTKDLYELKQMKMNRRLNIIGYVIFAVLLIIGWIIGLLTAHFL